METIKEILPTSLPVSKNVCLDMPEHYQHIISNIELRKPLAKIEIVQVANIVIDCLNYVYFVKNFGVPSKESILQMAKEISKIVHQKYKGFTEYDLKLACKLGAIGDLKEDGDINNVSIEVIATWLKRYQIKVRNEAMAKQKKYLEDKEKEYNEKYHKEGNLYFLNTIIKIYNDIDAFNKEPKKNISLIFDHLRNNGFVQIDKDKYEQIWETSYHRYKEIEQKENLFVICNREDIAKELALLHVFKTWLQQEKKLVIENDKLKLI